MTGLKLHIQAIMTGEKQPGPLLKWLLMILSGLYGGIVRIRGMLYDYGIFPTRKLSCGVISIGNLTVGGTGKTPMTIYLANLLRDLGYQPAVISRGYKGAAEKTGGIVSDRHNVLLGVAAAGDEPFLMAQSLKGIPVLVGADRFKTGMKAVERFSPDVIVLDDAFQHRRLERDIDIVLVDDQSFFGNRYMLPRGMLREPVSGISRADILVLTRCNNDSTGSLRKLSEMAPQKPVFRALHDAYVTGVFTTGKNGSAGRMVLGAPSTADFLKTAKVFVFSGIAKNDEFQKTVAGLAGEVTGAIGFNDHHTYTQTDFRRISSRAQKYCADYLVTTEKDYVKIAGKIQSPIDIVVVGIRIAFSDKGESFSDTIKNKVLQMLH